jgi:hypothetical protein
MTAMKTAYFDCFSGISGDMVLGACIDLGVPATYIEETLGGVIPGTFHLDVRRAERQGIGGCTVAVVVDEDRGSRNYEEIKMLVEACSLAERVKDISLTAFSRLAHVEARIHGCAVAEVHFHEIGGVDAMVDVIGAALGMEWLGVEDVVASEIPLGKGFVTCAHGVIPVPAPATIALLEGVPVQGTQVTSELVTPTGAAIVTSLTSRFGAMPRMSVDKVGYGVGKARLEDRPNLLRIIVGNREPAFQEDRIQVVETNIDDMNSEVYGFLMERLFEDGALDVSWVPIYMKKNRPGIMVQVLCELGVRERIVDRILTETTATGVRFHEVERRKLARRIETVSTQLGEVRVKMVSASTGTVAAPEYEDCRRIARDKRLPLRQVYQMISAEISKEKKD